jgi:PTH2 family peptidyl-tRNA hydrolase
MKNEGQVVIINGKPVLLGDLYYKMAIIVRKDIDMRPGKMGAQVAHAAIFADRGASPEIKKVWEESGERLVLVKVSSLEELITRKTKAELAGVKVYVQTDAGLTDIEAGTITCIALGPDAPETIDLMVGDLKLY